MQIQLRMPRQIKRHTQELGGGEKEKAKAFEDITFYCFLSPEFALSNLLRERQRHCGSEQKWHTDCVYISICRYVQPAEGRRREDAGEVLFLSRPWLYVLCLTECVRLVAFFFSTRHSEKI